MMSLEAKIISAIILIAALFGGYQWMHHRIYESGFIAGKAKLQHEIDDARAEAERNNKTIVKKDQELIEAKTEDKEKIITIYKTIREQASEKLIEVPVYRDCHNDPSIMRLIATAAAGGVRADSKDPASNPAASPSGP